MTRKSKRELETMLDRLESTIDPGERYSPEDLTEDQEERLADIFRDPEDLDDRERQHFENIHEWIQEEREEDVERPQHGLTPAEQAALDLLVDDGHRTLSEEYYEKYPDAPRPGYGEEYA